MSNKHLGAMTYSESRIQPILAMVLKKVMQQKPSHVQRFDDTRIFHSLETFGPKKQTCHLMSDGDNAGYLEAFQKAVSSNDISSLLGKVTWKDYFSEKLMWAFAAGEVPVLRERLIALCAYLICWLAEIDFREQSRKGGES